MQVAIYLTQTGLALHAFRTLSDGLRTHSFRRYSYAYTIQPYGMTIVSTEALGIGSVELWVKIPGLCVRVLERTTVPYDNTWQKRFCLYFGLWEPSNHVSPPIRGLITWKLPNLRFSYCYLRDGWFVNIYFFTMLFV
jgi:hypothetical protein